MAIHIDQFFGLSELIREPERDLAANVIAGYASILRKSFGPILPEHGLSIVAGIAQVNLENLELVEDLNHSFEKFAEQRGVTCGGSPNGSPSILDTITHGCEHALVGFMKNDHYNTIQAATIIDNQMRLNNTALILFAGEGLTEKQMIDSLTSAHTHIQQAISTWESSNTA